jgi:hypothetical protein
VEHEAATMVLQRVVSIAGSHRVTSKREDVAMEDVAVGSWPSRGNRTRPR